MKECEKKDDRQKKDERVGKNIAIEGDTFAFHLPARLFGLPELFRTYSDGGIIPFPGLPGQWRGGERDDGLSELTIQKMHIDLGKQG